VSAARERCCEGHCINVATKAVTFRAPRQPPSSPIKVCDEHVGEAVQLAKQAGIGAVVEHLGDEPFADARQLTFGFVGVLRSDLVGQS
jgi:hypothetical protein